MYASFFGLKQAPFSIAPDPHYLFMSERHREALAHLLYGLGGGGGFVLLTGEIGAGKTTVCRCFLEQIPPRCNVAYIFNPKLTVPELLRSVCDEFGIAVPAEASSVKAFVDPLNAFLLQAHAAGQSNVLIIDEAQNLSADVLEQLRLLTNLETSERKLLQIILIGQPELRGMLARPELEQLAQRVIARFHLGALSEAETEQYIRHRLQVAGLSNALPFDRKALQRIHQLTRGVPRRINLLCDRALLGAYANGQRQVSAAVVQQAAREVFDNTQPLAGSVAASQAKTTPARLLPLALALLVGGALGAVALSSLNRSAAPAATSAPPAATSASEPKAAASTPAASAPLAVVQAATLAAPAPAAPPITLAELPSDPTPAWQDLAKGWGLALGEASLADPCAALLTQAVQCYRNAAGSLALIRQIDRPVLLALQPAGQARRLILLVGLSGDTALLQIGDQRRSLQLTELAGSWRGEFITLWRQPPGYSRRAEQAAPFRDWLAQALLAASAAPASAPAASSTDTAATPSAAVLTARLQAFQATQGLQPDGLVGPITLMQLNRASGLAEPRLLAAP